MLSISSKQGSGQAQRLPAELASLRTKSSSTRELARFRAVVWGYWKENGRHDLAWRQPTLKLRRAKGKTFDPYHVLVSEVMLQQTQVPRVIEKYKEFLKRFPTVRALAKASLADVLKVWSGLGYNRRGKYLHDAAKEVVEKYGGKVPQDLAALRALPGIGPYTASAVRVFAFNEPDVLIETNIRAAYIHAFEKLWMSHIHISDKQILPIAQKAAKGQDPRKWHWALMDYGSYLKRIGVRNNHRSKHYVKQSKFEGSLRQVRGAILSALHEKPARRRLAGFSAQRVKRALEGLQRDGLIVKEKEKWRIA